MARTLICPQGHRWEFPANGLAPEPREPVACPVCGAVVELPVVTEAPPADDATLPAAPDGPPGRPDFATTQIRLGQANPRPGTEGGTAATHPVTVAGYAILEE